MKQRTLFLILFVGILGSCFVLPLVTSKGLPSTVTTPLNKIPKSASTFYDSNLQYMHSDAIYSSSIGPCDQLSWSFSTSPSTAITVYAMTSGNYTYYQANLTYSYYILSSGIWSSDSGNFEPTCNAQWYIVFNNTGSSHISTYLTYSASVTNSYYCSTSTTTTTYAGGSSFYYAQDLSTGTTSYLYIGSSSKYFEFYASTGDSISVSISVYDSNTLYLYLYNPSETELTYDYSSSYATVSATADSSGYYYIEINNPSGYTTEYSITVSDTAGYTTYSSYTSDTIPYYDFFGAYLTLYIVLIVVMLIINIALMVWIYRDANSRGMSGGGWVCLTLWFGWIACLIYMIVRKPKLMMGMGGGINVNVVNSSQGPGFPSYSPQGYPPQGYPPQGYPPQGSSSQGSYPSSSYPPTNYSPSGQPQYNAPQPPKYPAAPSPPTNTVMAPSAGQKICPNCGSPVVAAAKFCPNCGKTL